MLTQRQIAGAVEKVVYGLMILSFGILFSLNSHYVSSCPSNPDVENGQIYPLDNHGKIVYLTEAEDKKMLVARDSLFVIWILGIGMHVITRGLKRVNVP